MAVHVKVYTRAWCGYCTAALRLLRIKGVSFEEIDTTGDPATRRWLVETTGRSTVPQIFIDGEPGSGRQLLAAALHRLGPRAGRPFVAESLVALPESLQEPEIFGTNGSLGLAAEADGGTLYLAGIERLTARGQLPRRHMGGYFPYSLYAG